MTGQVNFAYYETFALALAVDLVNTRSVPTGVDGLRDAAGLARFLDDHADLSRLPADASLPAQVDLAEIAALYEAARARWAPTDADAATLRTLRDRLRGVFDSADDDTETVIDTLNEQLREHRALPRISAQHGIPHLHFEAADDGLVHWLAVTTLMALVTFVCAGRAPRLGLCASTGCQRAFVDRSKNGSKTYCSETCAHRESVTAFRQRRRAGTGLNPAG